MKIITCEQVSAGHPDKICDQIADAIVTDVLRHHNDARVAIECLAKDEHIIIAGELTSTYEPDYNALVYEVLDKIGWEKLNYGDPVVEGPNIHILVRQQSLDIALGVDTGGAGDQGMMYGYATNETPELLPVPFVVATKFLKILANHPSPMFKADAKAQVSFDYDSGKITTFLCSVQHCEDTEPDDFREIIESLMVLAASEYGLNTDFRKLVNPTGSFSESHRILCIFLLALSIFCGIVSENRRPLIRYGIPARWSYKGEFRALLHPYGEARFL